MKVIYKYPLELSTIGVMMPVGAQILSVKEQFGGIVIYALVDPGELKRSMVQFRVFGTGHPLPPEAIAGVRFLGTIKLKDGKLMFHVFVEGGE